MSRTIIIRMELVRNHKEIQRSDYFLRALSVATGVLMIVLSVLTYLYVVDSQPRPYILGFYYL